jgi:hypothetical protein
MDPLRTQPVADDQQGRPGRAQMSRQRIIARQASCPPDPHSTSPP